MTQRPEENMQNKNVQDPSLRSAADPVPRLAVPCGRFNSLPGLVVGRSAACVQVGIDRFDKRGAIQDLVSNIQDHKQDQTEVVDEELLDLEVGDECSESLGQDDQTVEKQPVPDRKSVV